MHAAPGGPAGHDTGRAARTVRRQPVDSRPLDKGPPTTRRVTPFIRILPTRARVYPLPLCQRGRPVERPEVAEAIVDRAQEEQT
ncbi:hypothetical protein GCM10027073_48730 [Streptomyces chlorus]